MKTFTELTAKLIEDHARKGGASVPRIDEELPATGYIVAVDSGPHFKNLKAMQLGAKVIEDYAKSQARTLNKSRYVLGSYTFENSERIAVDVSLVCEDLCTALVIAKARCEESIWDIQHGVPVYTPGI